MAPWGTTTPLGAPVLPEVKTTYAASSGWLLGCSTVEPADPPSAVTGIWGRSGGRDGESSDTTAHTGVASASIDSVRGSGSLGSTTRNAPPAFSTASRATTSSTERGSTTATTWSGPTPADRSARASPSARRSSSA